MTTSTSNTIRLHRVLKASPEKIYRAFLDGEALVKWMPPHGFTAKVHHLEAKVGGTYKMSFTNFTTGTSHSFGGAYIELEPNERIRHTDKFDTGLAGEMALQERLDLMLPDDAQFRRVQSGHHEIAVADSRLRADVLNV